jgi:hypothetical protein
MILDGGNPILYNVKTGKSTTYGGPSNPNQLTAVSCASSQFCMAVDDQGNAVSFLSVGWTSPDQSIDPGETLISVSCPTTTFCAAVDQNGDVLMGSSPR